MARNNESPLNPTRSRPNGWGPAERNHMIAKLGNGRTVERNPIVVIQPRPIRVQRVNSSQHWLQTTLNDIGSVDRKEPNGKTAKTEEPVVVSNLRRSTTNGMHAAAISGAVQIQANECPSRRPNRKKRVKCNSTILPRNTPVFTRKSPIERFQELLAANRHAPISVVNDVDDEGPPENFTYTDDWILGMDVILPDDGFLAGCHCEDGCGENTACMCLKGDDDTYTGRYDEYGRVKRGPRHAIWECNKLCQCSEDCPNRVVQRGRQVKLEIFRTPGKGWGVRTLEAIPRGTYVDQYSGELITRREASKREKYYRDIGTSYLFNLDGYEDINHESSQENNTGGYTVDAFRFGNITAFFNHSCNPNLAVYSVYTHPDTSIHKLAFFATKKIRSGEELTFDYAGPHSVSEMRQEHHGTVKCLCGAEFCRGYIL